MKMGLFEKVRMVFASPEDNRYRELCLKNARQMAEHGERYRRDWDECRQRGYQSTIEEEADRIFYEEKIGAAEAEAEGWHKEAGL